MLDFHSHILPGIDDGSRDQSESLQLLDSLRKQNVHRVIATPHFYAHRHTPDQFLGARAASYNSLEKYDFSQFPQMHLGAEVFYFDGMSRAEEMMDLRIQGTELLLVEMPFSTWNRKCINEILSLNEREDCTIVLAHIERYLSFQKQNVLNELLENRVKIQANAEYFLRWKTRHQAIEMLRHGMIHFLGSDCHNMNSRPPHIGEAMAYIRKKLGSEAIEWFDYHERRYFAEDEVLAHETLV